VASALSDQGLQRLVQVVGVNVFPERVRQVLLAHPHVKETAVQRMTPEEGDCLPVNAQGKATDWPCGLSEVRRPQHEGALGS
jgi:acyl-CoA synthetase (AMP-forming)/AMP-acid ligase II